ncbi:hypothetical protein ACFQV8_29270 [Pseudonocardia benzenivorans]
MTLLRFTPLSSIRDTRCGSSACGMLVSMFCVATFATVWKFDSSDAGLFWSSTAWIRQRCRPIRS